MTTRHALADAMDAVTRARVYRVHGHALNVHLRRLRAVALACDTEHGDADPDTWAAGWLRAVSSGHSEFPIYARIADDFEAAVPAKRAEAA